MNIGSSNAVLRQMTGRYLEGADDSVCVLDGDQRARRGSMERLMAKYAESSTEEQKAELSDWIADRIMFLPGSDWPEKWLVGSVSRRIAIALEQDNATALSQVQKLVDTLQLRSLDELRQYLTEAQDAGKHNEIARLSELVCAEPTRICDSLVRAVMEIEAVEVGAVVAGIRERLM